MRSIARSGVTRYDKLFTGIAVECPAWVKSSGATGCEDIGPEDTFDGDYGRLLARAYEKSVKVLASPREMEDFYTLVGSALRAA